MSADAGPARLAVIGAGSWGTALALLIARQGHTVALCARSAEHADEMRRDRRNRRYLPGYDFPATLTPLDDPARALAGADDVLVAVPSHALRATLSALAAQLSPRQRVLWATKGLEPETAKLPHQVAAEVVPADRATGALSGPSFAGEVARGLPTAVTIASTSADFARDMAAVFHDPSFRVYTSSDVVGVGVGGAAKNVLAIAVGFADGLGYGANTRALLITRGLGELMTLGETLGGRRETLTGMAGLGDLLLTCSDDQSRNRRLALALAAGNSVAAAEAEIGQTVEGVRVARALFALSQRHGLDLPITRAVYAVLHEGMAATDAADQLMARPFRPHSG